VNTVVYTPDGAMLLSGGDDNSIRFWDASNGELLIALPLASRSNSVAISPDGRRIASGNGDGSIMQWEMTRRELAAAQADE
jgi:WD40 repeat protein